MNPPAVPYAAYPKYGPEVLGTSEYDRQLKAWERYQASLRTDKPKGDDEHRGTHEKDHEGKGHYEDDDEGSENPPGGDHEPPEGDGMDSYTYVQKYRLAGQKRKRVFRKQGIQASTKGSARVQGRKAMETELGPQGPETWFPIGGTEKVSKPRGKPFKEGQDKRRNEDGSNGHGSSGGSGSGSGGGQGQGDGDGDGEGEGGDDDTPQMPTCPECGEPKGSTEGCCKPKDPGEIPPPEHNDKPFANLQLLRTDGLAPYMNEEAEERLRKAAHPEIVYVVSQALKNVDDWTRALVQHDVHEMGSELYEALANSHKALKRRMAKLPKGGNGKVGDTLSKAEIAKLVGDLTGSIDLDAIAAKVGEKLMVPKRIVIERNGERHEIKGVPHKMFEPALKAVNRGMNVFLVGPAGSGKGFLAQHIADALGRRFGFISCSEGMSEGMLLGRGVPLADRFLYLQSSFVDFYENGGVFLLDEIDAANPNVLLIINECLSSPHLSIPNRTEKPYAERHPEFVAIVAANTWGTGPNMEYVGRNRLDAAFLNRFVGSQIELGYDANVEGQIAKSYLGAEQAEPVLRRFWGVRKKLEEMNIRRIWSTRGLEKMCIALADGDDMATVLDAHTRGWTVDERMKAGVN